MATVLNTNRDERTTPGATRPRKWAAWLAASALVLGAAGNLGQSLVWQLHGGRPDGVDAQLTFAADHGTAFAVSCLLGTLAVPFMAHGFLTASRLLSRRSRRTGLVAGVLLLVGMWGFQAMQIAETIQLAAMLDQADSAAHWMDSLADQPLLLVFGVPFMAFTPIGLLVLSIGALVTRAFPRWIAAMFLAFALVEFVAGSLGPVDPHWLYLIAASGLAVHVVKSGYRAWDHT